MNNLFTLIRLECLFMFSRLNNPGLTRGQFIRQTAQEFVKRVAFGRWQMLITKHGDRYNVTVPGDDTQHSFYRKQEALAFCMGFCLATGDKTGYERFFLGNFEIMTV